MFNIEYLFSKINLLNHYKYILFVYLFIYLINILYLVVKMGDGVPPLIFSHIFHLLT